MVDGRIWAYAWNQPCDGNPFGHGALGLKKRWRIGRELGKEGYDQVIVLPGSLKSAIIALATGIKQRNGLRRRITLFFAERYPQVG